MHGQNFIVTATIAALAIAAESVQGQGSAWSANLARTPAPSLSQDPDSAVIYLDVDFPIATAAPDGAGGWFIGGSFTKVAGQRRVRLAHVTADGQLDPTWKPVVKGRTRYPGSSSLSSPSVSALSVIGNTVYVGGWFTSINNRPRSHLAAVDARTGRVRAWNPKPNWPVQALATDSHTVYAGGLFTRIGRARRGRLAAFDDATGRLTAWNPRVAGAVRSTFKPEVTALLFDRGRIYAGGLFTRVGGRGRYGVAAIDAATGAPTAWHASVGQVYALARSGDTLYVGGFFGQIDLPQIHPEVGSEEDAYRYSLAALNLPDGRLLPWQTEVDNGVVNALAVVGDRLYVGGTFEELAGEPHKTLGAVSTISGAGIPWQPRPSKHDHYSLVPAGERVLIGGEFRGQAPR